MAGDYAVFESGERIGRVMRFVGEPASRRWVAYSVHTPERRGFPTRRAAMDWLGAEHDKARAKIAN